ncbi:MAG: hypothetical protein HY561_06600 [Gemmatimonadetes bacterium]|nr:hypothetical protein [Gemmatimonadota bacterium]
MRPSSSQPVLDPVRPVFRAIAATVVPEAARLGEAEWSELEGSVEKAVAERPPKMRRQLRLLIRTLELLPVFRYGRRFSRLDAAARRRFLEKIQDSPILLLRRGFWGLRTLVLLGYYTRAAAAGEIGYAADPRGWDAWRERRETHGQEAQP